MTTQTIAARNEPAEDSEHGRPIVGDHIGSVYDGRPREFATWNDLKIDRKCGNDLALDASSEVAGEFQRVQRQATSRTVVMVFGRPSHEATSDCVHAGADGARAVT